MRDLLAANCYDRRMAVARAVLATMIAAVVIVGPALFMASSPCLDCDGVCGSAATVAVVLIAAVLPVLPLTAESRPHLFSAPLRPSELPPRPLFATA
jgi:hypothetical protein